MSTETNPQSETTPGRKWPWILAVLLLLGISFYAKMGFYSIQPLGALPDGATAIVWRDSDEPFFNSADALCLERLDGVSLMCRAMAMGQAPTDRIVMRLPYQHWAYLRSTGGREFDR